MNDDPLSEDGPVEARLEPILATIQRFAALDFSHQAPICGVGDITDALAAGVNMLGEELGVLRHDMEGQVEERTRQLGAANRMLEAEAGQRRRTEDALQRSNDELRVRVDELEQLHREVSRLSDMSNLLQACQSRDEAFSALAHASQLLFTETNGCIYIYPPSRDQLSAVTHWGDSAPAEADVDVNDCWGLRRGRLHYSATGEGQLRCRHIPSGDFSAYCMPLTAQGDILGLLHLRSAGFDQTVDTHAGDRRQQLVEAAAEQIALALANLELRSALESQSIRDPLTGLFNRRYFEESLARELNRARRAGSDVAVMVADVDGFKHFNDSFGHTAGDLALREIANSLQGAARAEDVVCRYGGEELAVIMADVDADTAYKRACTVTEAVRDLRVEWRGQLLPRVTISVGIAVYPQHGTTANAVFEAADAALYQAKGAGRDQAMVAEPSGQRHD